MFVKELKQVFITVPLQEAIDIDGNHIFENKKDLIIENVE